MRLPDSWVAARLDSVCLLNPKLAPDERPEESTAVTFVPMSAVDENAGVIASPETRTYGEVAKGYTSFKEGDVLFAKVTPCMENGKAAIARLLLNGLGFGSTEFHVIRPSNLVLSGYLFHFLRQPTFRAYAASAFVGTGGLQRVPTDFLARVKLPLPTLPEQQRIVDILRQTESLGENRTDTRAGIAIAIREHYAQLFGDIFANDRVWPNAKLGNISEIVRGSSPRPQGDPRLFGGPVPRLMVSDLTRDGLWVDAKTDSLTEEGAKSSRAMSSQAVVIAVSGAPGLTAILNHDACIHDGFVGLRDLDPALLPEFVGYTLNLLRAKYDQQAVGAVFRNLTTDQVKAITIPLPPIELQRKFQEYLFQVKAIQANIAHSNKLLGQLLSAISIGAFSGELTTTWRESHRARIGEAAIARDAAMRERGAKISVRIIETIPPERKPLLGRTARYGILNEVSDFQGFVFDSIREWKGTLLADDGAQLDDFCRQWPIEHERNMHDRVRRALEQLAALGLIAKVALPNGQGEFVTGYRMLRPDEETKARDIGRLETALGTARGADGET